MSLLCCTGVPDECLLLVGLGPDSVGETVSCVVLAEDVSVLGTLAEPLDASLSFLSVPTPSK